MNDEAKQPSHSTALRPPGPLESPMLNFNLDAEIEKLRAENSWHGGRNSKTLVKYSNFRVVLIVFQRLARMEEHKTEAQISIEVASGHVRMKAQDRVFDLPKGHILALERGMPHDVEALEDSAILLTFAWPEGAHKS
ncbi:MAG: cupin domain-containing protein [Candidatus Acidiferrales bacterium]